MGTLVFFRIHRPGMTRTTTLAKDMAAMMAFTTIFMATSVGCKWPSSFRQIYDPRKHQVPHYPGSFLHVRTGNQDHVLLHKSALKLKLSLRGGWDVTSSYISGEGSFSGAEEASTQDSSSHDMLPENDESVRQPTSFQSKMGLMEQASNRNTNSRGRNWTELAMAAWRRDKDDEDAVGEAQPHTRGEGDEEDAKVEDDISLDWKHGPDSSYESGELAELQKRQGDDEPWIFQEPEGGDPDALFEEAVALHEEGGDKLYEAERLYRRILGLDPSHVGTLCNFGSLSFDFRKDIVTARRAYRRALRLQPDDIPTLTNYADMVESAIYVSASSGGSLLC